MREIAARDYESKLTTEKNWEDSIPQITKICYPVQRYMMYEGLLPKEVEVISEGDYKFLKVKVDRPAENKILSSNEDFARQEKIAPN